MTSSKGASSSGFDLPFEFLMFSTIPHRKANVTTVGIDRVLVEVLPMAL